MKESKRYDRVVTPPVGNPSSWMFISGAVILGFLLLHIIDMKLQLRSDVTYADEHQAFANAVAVLSNPISRVVYCIGTIFLGFHLAHGFSSAFQSLGLTHPKYTPTIKAIGVAFAILIGAGFFALPLLVPAIHSDAPQAISSEGEPAPPAPEH